MADPVNVSVDASGLADSFGAAGAEITRVAREEIAPAAKLIEDAFSSAASGVERDLSRAARAGSLSLKGLASALVSDLQRAVVDTFVKKPVESFLSSAFSSLFGGARAGGGPAAPGASFLVGERGPELFTPSVSGRIDPISARAANVTIVLPGVSDPESFRRSETQIAAAAARALARAGRND